MSAKARRLDRGFYCYFEFEGNYKRSRSKNDSRSVL